MGAQVLLYGYGLVCISMLVFNLFYGLHLRSDDRRLTERSDQLRRQVELQLARLREEQNGMSRTVSVKHLTWMRRRLSRVNGLLSFDELMEELKGRDVACDTYVRQLQPVFLYLATVYLKRENTQAAYYCYFLAKHRLHRRMETDPFQQVILSYLRKDSLYCKINALKALCSFGSPAILIDALVELSDRRGSQFHEKVITEALLTYAGDTDALIELLWARLHRFSLPIQRAVLDYIRFQSGDFCGRMMEIMEDTHRDKELRLAAIRYFGKYLYPPARARLLEFLQDPDPTHWEYAAISATALARYEGQDVVDALLRAMNSSNWYIRNNASASLETRGLTYEEMLRVLRGDDRYAWEMLTYRLKAKQLEQAEHTPSAGDQESRKGELAGV
ncbi:MAG: HEAT repeat domain-containing protein [Butyricicoccus sp.]|nr:HEAT repeat domain-containing protein [Butyricicoccus sp.]